MQSTKLSNIIGDQIQPPTSATNQLGSKLPLGVNTEMPSSATSTFDGIGSGLLPPSEIDDALKLEP